MSDENNLLPFDSAEEAPRFDGATYDPAIDHERLGAQIIRIANFFADGDWHTLREAEDATGDPQASISAQLRHLRKARFGGHTIEKQRREPEAGTYEYRLIQNPQAKITFPR